VGRLENKSKKWPKKYSAKGAKKMPVMVIERTPSGLLIMDEYQTYQEMMADLEKKVKRWPSAYKRKVRKGNLTIFEGKHRAAAHIVQSILDEEE
jgi:16S rRNA U516 pseudouridylate synthase RsuA-like enzyme